jgi:two-component sensor histidine kinase
MRWFVGIFILGILTVNVLQAQKPEGVSLQNILRMPDDTLKADSLWRCGDRLMLVNIPKSIEYFRASLAVAEQIQDPRRIADALFRLGYQEKRIEQQPEALAHLQRAYQLYDQLQMHRNKLKCILKIAQVFDEKLDFTSALSYYRRLITLSKQYGIEDLEAMAYSDMANILSVRLKDYAAATDAYNKSIVIFEKLNLGESLNIVMVNLGVMYIKLRQFNKALNLFNQTLLYCRRGGDADLSSEAIALGRIGEIYYEQKNYLLAEQKVKESLLVAKKEGGLLEIRADHLDLLRKIYEAKGDVSAAYETQKKWRVLYDTLTNQNARKSLTMIQTKFETAQKEAQIKSLDDQTKAQRTQLISAIIGLSILLVLLIGSGYLYLKLNESKRKVEEQSERLRMLMRELHHRVKNNLAIVSNLLMLQSNRLNDDKAAQAVREGQQRVNAMAFIHQRLYQTDEVATIDMQQYVQDLLDNLSTAYGLQRHLKTELLVDIPPLSVDVAIPLGLIINELLTNSFKYAYAQVSDPFLGVWLQADSFLTLRVRDNGPGLDLQQWHAPSKSFGKRLINSLTKQLEGEITVSNQDGCCVQIKIPNAHKLEGASSSIKQSNNPTVFS